MTALREVVISAALLAVLAGCAGKSKDTAEPPAKLTEFETVLDIEKLWSSKVGGKSERLRLGLRGSFSSSNSTVWPSLRPSKPPLATEELWKKTSAEPPSA